MRILLYNGSFLILFLFAQLPTSLHAQQPTYSFKSEISADSILIGDQVEFTIKATVPENYKVYFPSFTDTLVTDLEVLGQPSVDTVQSKSGKTDYLYSLMLTSFDEGFYRIPRIKLPFSDGTSKDTAQTSSISLLVNTMPADSTANKIYDIKMPIEEPLTFAEVAPWVGGSLLLAGLIALLVIYLIKRKRGESLFFPAKPSEPPHIVALRELNKIQEQKLWNTDNHKHFHSVLTEVIRDYIEGRYGVPAMEQTTDETIRNLKNYGEIDSKLLDDLLQNLSLADLVKFAKFTPNISENETSLKFGFRFVNETMVEEEKDEEEGHKDNTNSLMSESNEKTKAIPVKSEKTSKS
ncbi:MAG: isopeptide-forming domain-containing fimbrial protein [Bacteroidales bacterium]